MNDRSDARRNMVDGQVRVNEVTDRRILGAMLEVPRELFVEPGQEARAYLDIEAPVLEGETPRCLTKPMVAARLLQAAQIGPFDHVLVVGAATGYTAVLATRLSPHVTAVESDPTLLARAQSLVAGMATTLQLQPRIEGGPYDAIILDGGTEIEPTVLIGLLADGGRLTGIKMNGIAGEARVWTRIGGEASSRRLFSARAPVVPGFEKPRAFAF